MAHRPPSPKEELLDILKSKAGDRHPIHQALLGWCSNSTTKTRAYLNMRPPESQPARMLEHVKDYAAEGELSVCVVENIDSDWIAELGVAWGIERDFFLRYAANPDGALMMDSFMVKKLRETMQSKWMPWKVEPPSIQDVHAEHFHVAGVVSHLIFDHSDNGYPRPCAPYCTGGSKISVRMSYYRVNKLLYLFLVDRPQRLASFDDRTLRPSKLSLWVPVARHPRAIPVPQLFSQPNLVLFDMMRDFVSSPPNLELLFTSDAPIDPAVFAYFLSLHMLRSSLDYLDQEIKNIAFRDIKTSNKPGVEINDRLHDLRYHLDTLRAGVLAASGEIPPRIEDIGLSYGRRRFVFEFAELLSQCDRLEKFLVDTFQLLISTVNILDAQANKLEATRSSRLTQLAMIYVPLSFATGIFGMNVKEINGSSLSVWVFVVSLIIISVATLALLWTITHFREYLPGSKRQSAVAEKPT